MTRLRAFAHRGVSAAPQSKNPPDRSKDDSFDNLGPSGADRGTVLENLVGKAGILPETTYEDIIRAGDASPCIGRLVLLKVAENPETPEYVLERLAGEERLWSVRRQARRNLYGKGRTTTTFSPPTPQEQENAERFLRMHTLLKNEEEFPCPEPDICGVAYHKKDKEHGVGADSPVCPPYRARLEESREIFQHTPNRIAERISKRGTFLAAADAEVSTSFGGGRWADTITQHVAAEDSWTMPGEWARSLLRDNTIPQTSQTVAAVDGYALAKIGEEEFGLASADNWHVYLAPEWEPIVYEKYGAKNTSERERVVFTPKWSSKRRSRDILEQFVGADPDTRMRMALQVEYAVLPPILDGAAYHQEEADWKTLKNELSDELVLSKQSAVEDDLEEKQIVAVVHRDDTGRLTIIDGRRRLAKAIKQNPEKVNIIVAQNP